MATKYKKLKWGTNTPETVTWVSGATTFYPGLVKWGSDVVFARAVDVNWATKTGINTFSSKLTDYAVPSSVVRSSYYFYGDKITVTPVLASWWTVTPADKVIDMSGQFNAYQDTFTTVSIGNFFTPSRTPRDSSSEIYIYRQLTVPTPYEKYMSQTQAGAVTYSVKYLNTSDGTAKTVDCSLTTNATSRTIACSDIWAATTQFTATCQVPQTYCTYIFETWAQSDDIPGTSAIDLDCFIIPATRNLVIHRNGALKWYGSIEGRYDPVTNKGEYNAFVGGPDTTVWVPFTIAADNPNTEVTYNDFYAGTNALSGLTINYTSSVSSTYLTYTVNSNIPIGRTTADVTINLTGKSRTLDYQEKGDSAAFNANRVLVFTDPTTGSIQEVHPTGSHQYTMWQGEAPIYTPITNTYYTINVTSTGTAAGTTTATITATGAAKERTLNIGAFAYGMSKFSWSATSDSGSTTVTTGTSATLKQPYTYNYSITIPSPDYFNITMSPTKNEPGNTNINVSFSSTGKTRSYKLYWGNNITSVTGQYINGSFITTNYAPTVSGSGSKTYTDVWRGAGITVNATATSYYTPEYATSNMDAGINDAACTITAAATPRKVRVAFAGSYSVALASVTVNFASVGATGTAKNYHPTSSTNYTEVWAGSDVTTTAQANQYFNIDVDKPTITKDSAAGDATVNISGSYAYRSWTIATKSGYQNIDTHTFSYIKTTNPDVVTTATSYTTYDRVWQGGKCTINATAASYWTPVVYEGLISHSGSSDTYTYEFAESTNNILSSLGAARRPRNLKVNLHETDSRVSRALSSVTVVYQDTSGNFQTVNPTTSTTYIAWSGYAITASATSKNYASVTVTSTDWAAGYTDAIVDVTCTLASRQAVIALVQNEDSCISNMTLTYVKSDTGASTAVSPAQAGTYYYVWQGAAVNLYVGLTNNYYTHSITSYNTSATSSTASFYVYASARSRYVSGTFTSISKVSASSSEHNVDITGSGYYLKQPYAYDLTVTAAQYWKNATVSPTQVAAGSTTVTLTLSAERATRNLFVDVYNRDRGAGTVTATYGGTSSSVSTSVSISGTTTNTNSGLLSAWQGEAVTYTYSVTDSTNYTMVVTSSGTAIGNTAAYITANIYGKTVQHTLSVWPSTLGTWYLNSTSNPTTSLSVSRNSPMTYSNWTGTLRTATISAKSLSTSLSPYVQCTLNYVLMSLSTQPYLGPTTATTFTAYIGKPVTLTLDFNSSERARSGLSSAILTYYPTFGVCSQSRTYTFNLWQDATIGVNSAQTNKIVFTRKSSFWTMVINGTNRTSTSYTISNISSNTTVTVDAFRNTPTDMSLNDGYHIRDAILDCTDGWTLNGQMTIWNDTNYSVKFYIHFEADTSGGHWSSTERTVTVAAKSSQFWSEDYYDDSGEIESGELYIRCEEESTANDVADW